MGCDAGRKRKSTPAHRFWGAVFRRPQSAATGGEKNSRPLPLKKGRSVKSLHLFFGIFCEFFTVDAIEKDGNKRYNQLVRLKRQNDFFNTSLTLQNRGEYGAPLPAMRAKAKTRVGGPHKGVAVYLNDTR